MARYTPRGAGARNSFRGTATKPKPKPKPGKGLIGSAKPGKAGLGSKIGTTKPGFKQPGAPKPNKPAVKPAVAQKPAVTPQTAAPDSIYNDAVDLAARKEEQRLGELEGKEEQVKREFGIEDPTDPFSRANALKSSFLARQKAASAGLASQGQLYSGAHERAISRTRREEEQARHELRQVYEQAIGAIGSEKAGVKFATEEERAQAFEDWLARAPEADEPGPTEAEVDAAEAAEDLPQPTDAPANGVERPSEGPVLIGQGPQGNRQTQAEHARAQARATRKAAALRAKVAAKKAKKAEERQKQEALAKKLEGNGPIASINRPGQKGKPKGKPKSKPKGKPKGKGRR